MRTYDIITCMRTLYPNQEPFKTHFFQREQHILYVEQCGNPDGLPVVFLHGGPGSGSKPHHRCFFNPDRYHIIVFDQRGSGRSLPCGLLEQNTTHDLLNDLEFIRLTLRIKKWLLFGGSWGSTLALLYAQKYPDRTAGLVLRGSFLARQCDLEWFAGNGVNQIYPDTWESYIKDIHDISSGNLVENMYRMLTGNDQIACARAATAWFMWGTQIILGNDFDPDQAILQAANTSIVNQSRLELHYAVNKYFISENQILLNCHQIYALPCILIHGRMDLTCPVVSSYLLHKHLPRSRLVILSDAGHTSSGISMINALVEATDHMIEGALW